MFKLLFFQENELKKDARTPWLRRFGIVAGWILLGYMGWAASQMHEGLRFETWKFSKIFDYLFWSHSPEFRPDFDPFEILGVNKDDFTDFESFKKPAKKIYREKSRTLHPDKKCAEWMKDRSRLFITLKRLLFYWICKANSL